MSIVPLIYRWVVGVHVGVQLPVGAWILCPILCLRHFPVLAKYMPFGQRHCATALLCFYALIVWWFHSYRAYLLQPARISLLFSSIWMSFRNTKENFATSSFQHWYIRKRLLFRAVILDGSAKHSLWEQFLHGLIRSHWIPGCLNTHYRADVCRSVFRRTGVCDLKVWKPSNQDFNSASASYGLLRLH